MRDELEMQLQSDFPFMQQNRVEAEKNIYRRWGCECSDGWYKLIRELCHSITERYQRDGKSVDITVLQIKEKFATLRFYYKYDDTSSYIPAIDFIGSGTSVRFSPDGDDTDEETAKLRKDIAEIVRSFEHKSGTVCEFCGNLGEVRKDLFWLRTLCDNCYSKYPENKKRK